jgi:hypothetical protein
VSTVQKHRSSRATAFRSSLSTLYLKRAREKGDRQKRVKKSAGYCFIDIGHKEPGRVRAEVSKRSHLAVWESIVYIKKN